MIKRVRLNVDLMKTKQSEVGEEKNEKSKRKIAP